MRKLDRRSALVDHKTTHVDVFEVNEQENWCTANISFGA
jgi:hypothetical protein